MIGNAKHIGDIIERVGAKTRSYKIEYVPNYGVTTTRYTTNGDGRFIARLASRAHEEMANERREGIDLMLTIVLGGVDVTGWSFKAVCEHLDSLGAKSYRDLNYDMMAGREDAERETQTWDELCPTL